jgi:membrane peptidoglycan carboxypeptidase
LSSKADDFDVRYRDGRDDRAWGNGADEGYADGGYTGNEPGGLGGTVDYDLGYDANGWDTQGFRSPAAGYADNHETAQLGSGVGTADRPGNGRGGSHARTASTQQVNWAPEAPGTAGPWLPDQPQQPGRRGHRARPGSPGGPGGPQGPRGPRVKVKGSWWRHWTWRKVVGVLLSIIGGLVVLIAAVVAYIYSKTPVPAEQMAISMSAQSVVYASDGHTVIGRFGSTDRQVVSYQQIPTAVIDSVLSAEDRNFFNEGGVSPTSILRAAWEDTLGGGDFQGGSTITQQFVRNFYEGIGTAPTVSRKIKEIFVAMKISRQKSKQWILENYLNTIYLGQGAYGIGAAAQTYFNIPVSRLSTISWSQAALLAAIIQQPSTYPLPQYRAELKARWQYVLNGMVQTGTLSQQKASAMKFPAPGDFIAQSVGSQVWDPYVLNMVYNELIDVYHFSQSQIYNGGYVIRTSIDDAKMAALYQAVITNEAVMDESGVPFNPLYMHAGAVLEDPATGAIEALYPGPGYPGSKYNGIGKVISKSYCKKIACQVNMAVYNREQVGSSFKPYVLATAVKQGMNVQTSTLDGYDNLCIPPDNLPTAYPQPTIPTATAPYIGCQTAGYYPVPNDSAGENGPYTPQVAMAASINTAYTDLWHTVGGSAVADMAQAFGVDTDAACITADCGTGKNTVPKMVDEAGVALGQASLTVGEQATMLATIDDYGVYHDAHVITSINQNNGPPTPIKVTSYPVFSTDPTLNAEEATQVQYAMSEDTASYGTAPTAGLTNGQEIIAKTGTTNTAQSAFFIGAIPSQALAVALFTNEQGQGDETLNNLGGNSQGGFGGTWPATIWHTYGENMFVPLGVEQFTVPTFTGSLWNEVPPNLRKVPKKHRHNNNNDWNNNGNGNWGNGNGNNNGNGNGGNGNGGNGN